MVSNTESRARKAFVSRCMKTPDLTVHPECSACSGSDPTRLLKSKNRTPGANKPGLQAWEALVKVGKYVRRSSYWEALGQLHEARANVFRLWALAERVPQARYGITALVDAGASMPSGIDKSIGGATAGDVLDAARHLADVLIRLQHRLTSNDGCELPNGFAAFVAADLATAGAECQRFE